jgi:radical SAM-linked protein
MPETPAPLERSDGQRFFASYQKLGNLRFASHLDLIRLIGRTFNRAGISLFRSRGFHPKPLFTFGPALSVGKESVAEWVEFASLDTGTEEQFLMRVNRKCPEGLRFTRWQAVPSAGPTLTDLIEWAEYSVVLSPRAGGKEAQLESLSPALLAAELEKRVAVVLHSHSLEVQRRKRDRIRKQDIRPGILRLSVSPAEPLPRLKMVLSTVAAHSVRPEEVLSLLLENSFQPWQIRRERLGIVHDDEIFSPADYFNLLRIGAEIDLHAERTYCQQQLT